MELSAAIGDTTSRWLPQTITKLIRSSHRATFAFYSLAQPGGQPPMPGEERRAQMAAVLSRQELMRNCAFTADVVQATSMECLRTTANRSSKLVSSLYIEPMLAIQRPPTYHHKSASVSHEKVGALQAYGGPRLRSRS
jgi:hypothetical protein